MPLVVERDGKCGKILQVTNNRGKITKNVRIFSLLFSAVQPIMVVQSGLKWWIMAGNPKEVEANDIDR